MRVPKIKMKPDQLQEYLLFKKRGNIVPAKKGKGCIYKRAKLKSNLQYEKQRIS